ncbi:hypothetical protein M8J76_014166 [Diaphorina citri]|nr:hypothetical protein M8J75_008566 [Diaphorina citri]KAI5737497.1 hypothetical protein M8J76_014166 [Diaphorina citri]KAI5743257.1 hypothetical protein M8J77_016204 [Diaphorina citri]
MLVFLLLQSFISVPVLSYVAIEYLKITEKWCLDGKFHKSLPGPEDELHSQCTPWKSFSCCTHNISKTLHYGNLYNFDLNHCAHIKPMSVGCKRHFIQDSCFYECEPNVRPWAVRVNMTDRKERFYKVPLCQSDCEAWYRACENDYTCAKNWVTDFKWGPGGNKCSNSKCITFREMFQNSSKKFCEGIWDDAWEETDDTKPCMRIWFNGTFGNPNDEVAQIKLAEMGIGDTAMFFEPPEEESSRFPWLTLSFCVLLLASAGGYYAYSRRDFNIFSLKCL